MFSVIIVLSCNLIPKAITVQVLTWYYKYVISRSIISYQACYFTLQTWFIPCFCWLFVLTLMLKHILDLNIIADMVGHLYALLTTEFIFEFQVFYWTFCPNHCVNVYHLRFCTLAVRSTGICHAKEIIPENQTRFSSEITKNIIHSSEFTHLGLNKARIIIQKLWSNFTSLSRKVFRSCPWSIRYIYI